MKLNKLITTIEIEMSGETKRYLVSAKQGDKATRFIRAKLKNMGGKYLIPDGANAIVNITKPDNKHVYNTCDYEENEVFIELTSQILAVSGTAFCDIEIRNENNEQVITSVTFEIEIEKEIRNENALESSNEFTELERMVALSKSYAVGGTGSRAGEDTDNAKYYKGEAQEARDKAAASAAGAGTSAETAIKSAKESQSYAVGGTGSRAGEDTDNAKYYKGQSQDARDKAAASAAGAGTSAETAVKSAKESKSYAVGGTGSRAGEDTDNAKYYSEKAKKVIEEIGYPVTGVKGEAETAYRNGNVNLTKKDIGLGNVPDVTTNDQRPTFTSATSLANLVTGEKLTLAFSKIAKAVTELISHIGNKNNPHVTTKGQVGLGNVDNTSDVNKPVSTAQKAAIDEVKRYTEYHEIVQASGSVMGHVELTNSVNSTSTTTAAVPASVKAVYDLANSKAEGLMTNENIDNLGCGIYLAVNSANLPISNNWFMIISSGDRNTQQQLAVHMETGTIYTRARKAGNWTGWINNIMMSNPLNIDGRSRVGGMGYNESRGLYVTIDGYSHRINFAD